MGSRVLAGVSPRPTRIDKGCFGGRLRRQGSSDAGFLDGGAAAGCLSV
jgi:hypothetical protein